MDAKTKARLRKSNFVSHRIQGKLLERFAVYWAVYHVVLWHAMFFYHYMQYRGQLLAGGAPMTFSQLYGQFTAEHYSMIVCAVAVVPIILWDVLILTHRVAGPLVRFGNEIKKMARGERVEKMRLRDGDLLDEFLVPFNELVEAVNRGPSLAGPAQQNHERASEPAGTPCGESDAFAEQQVLCDLENLQSLVAQAASGAERSAGSPKSRNIRGESAGGPGTALDE